MSGSIINFAIVTIVIVVLIQHTRVHIAIGKTQTLVFVALFVLTIFTMNNKSKFHTSSFINLTSRIYNIGKYKDKSATDRILGSYEVAMKSLLDSHFLGMGSVKESEYIQNNSFKYKNPKNTDLHTIPSQLIFRFGIFGIAATLYVIFITLKRKLSYFFFTCCFLNIYGGLTNTFVFITLTLVYYMIRWNFEDLPQEKPLASTSN